MGADSVEASAADPDSVAAAVCPGAYVVVARAETRPAGSETGVPANMPTTRNPASPAPRSPSARLSLQRLRFRR